MNRDYKFNFTFLSKICNARFTIQILFCLIILIATWTRIWGIWNGYPYSYYGDEIHFVKRSLSFGSGDLNPHWFHKPAFFMYLLFFEYGILFVIGKLISLWNNVNGFAIYYINNPGLFYIIGRITVVLFSVGTVLLTWVISFRFYGKISAIVSSIILSLSFGAIVTAKNIKADTPCAFFTLLSLFFLLNYISKNTKRNSRFDLFFSSIFAGVGTATKYYSIIMMVPIAIAELWLSKSSYKTRIIEIIKQFIVFGVSFFICSPFNFLDPIGLKSIFYPVIKIYNKIFFMINDPQNEIVEKLSRETIGVGQSFSNLMAGFSDYFSTLSEGLNPFVLLLSLVGIFYVFYHKNKKGVILLIFPIIFISLSVFFKTGNSEIRHQLPVLPFIAILAGFSIKVFEKSKITYAIFIILLTFFSIHDFNKIAAHNTLLAKPDVRNVTQEWFESNVPAGTKIIIDEDGPYFKKSLEQVKEEITIAKTITDGAFTTHYGQYLKYQFAAFKSQVNHVGYRIFTIRIPWWRKEFKLEGVHQLDSEFDADMGNPLKAIGVMKYGDYVAEGYKYAIIHSHNYLPFLRENGKSIKFPAYGQLYRDLLSKGTLYKQFDGMVPNSHPESFKKMTIKIIKLQ